jgi:squalene synthase HpnC
VIHRVVGAKAPPWEALPVPSAPYELDACYRYCEAMARARHHNFPVASLFVPTALRRHIFPVYAFARTADEIASEPEYEGRRAREIDAWEAKLEACFFGETPDHPVFVALADTIARFDLPITPFSGLLTSARMDLDIARYSTMVDLMAYTHVGAASIGHVMLYLGGYRDASLHRYASDLAHALAHASFWQYLKADLDRDRIYVPAEDLSHFDLTEADLRALRPTPALDALVRYEVARTRALFERSRPLVDRIGPDFAIEIALMWHGGMRILDKIERAGSRVLSKRPRLNNADKAAVVLRALAWRGTALSHRGETLARWLAPERAPERAPEPDR